jgi:hypothetical protein
MNSQKGSACGHPERGDWVAFAGGELEGRPPTALCASCRAQSEATGSQAPRAVLCFQCYQADLARQRALKAAADLDTASNARFQCQLPFEPVNRPRLERLRTARAQVRASASTGSARFEQRRRQAQIAARHALQRIVAGVRRQGAVTPDETRAFASAVHAAELQLPESWLPFVVSR